MSCVRCVYVDAYVDVVERERESERGSRLLVCMCVLYVVWV